MSAPFPIDEAMRDISWDALGERHLCDSCLGRLVAHLGRGMTNSERGAVLRSRLDLPAPSVCWMCEGLVNEVEKFADLVLKAFEGWEFRSFLVGSRVAPDVAAREEELWTAAGSLHAEPIKGEINREVGKIIEGRTDKIAEFEHPEVVAVIETAFDVIELQVSPLFIAGRYRKLVRGIPQTRWPCRKCKGKGCEHCGGRGKMYETSVEEIVAATVIEQSEGSGHALHGMGREDVDARMLGNGRPFIVEIEGPRRRNIDLEEVARRVNASGTVEVTGLRLAVKGEIVGMKEAVFDKTYRLLVRVSSPVNEEKVKEGLTSLLATPVAQRTPLRVSHRRSDKVRERRIRSIDARRIDDSILELVIRVEAGSYVKELVHGDHGRTEPNLAGALGVECDVLELDVLEVHDGE